jgi:hypothetical protein
MNHRRINLLLASVTLLALTAPLLRAQDPQRVSPPRNWGLAYVMYSQFREDYDSMPVTVIRLSGGKLSPHEKFKIEVTGLANRSTKTVTSAAFTWYLFDNNDLDKVVDSGKTGLIELAVAPNEQRDCAVLILHIEDIPLLRDKNPPGTYRLEVGVTKVTYSDGSTWEAAGTPGKVDRSKVPH